MNPVHAFPRWVKILTTELVLLIAMLMFSLTSFGETSSPLQIKSLEDTHAGLGRKSPEGINKRALLVGISQYGWAKPPTFPELKGPHNDVEAMRVILMERFGFNSENIRVLKDKEATRESILKNFQEFIIRPANQEDIVLFYYSGHGSTAKDLNGDEADGYDETLVPYDGRDPDGRIPDIRDDEVHDLLIQVSQKKAYPIIILDSCHSGSGARIPNLLTERKIPADTRVFEQPQAPMALKKIDGEKGKGFIEELGPYIALTASGDSQSAFEIKIQGKFVGAFSHSLLETLHDLSPNATYRELITKVRKRIKRYLVNQRPQFEGDIFGKVFRTGASQGTRVISVKRLSKSQAILGAGAIHGVTEGSKFDVYALGHADKGKSEAAVATLKVKEVFPDQAAADAIQGEMTMKLGEALETAHNYGDLALKIAYNPSDQSLQTAIQPMIHSKLVQVVNSEELYDLRMYTSDDELILEHLDKTIYTRIPKHDSNIQNTLEKRIKKLARHKVILALNNDQSELELRVELERIAGNSPSETWSKLTNPKDFDNGDVKVQAGDRVRFVMTNVAASKQPAHVYAFYLGPDYSVVPIYPARGAEDNILAAGHSVYTPPGRVELASHNRGSREMIMVIATNRPIPLWHLEQKGVPRYIFQSPLERLLHDTMAGTRSAFEKTVPLADWTTRFLGVLVVQPSSEKRSLKPPIQTSKLKENRMNESPW